MEIGLFAALAAGKGLIDFFGAKARAESARERIRELKQRNWERRREEQGELYGNISRMAADQTASVRQSGMARAAAMGRPQDASLLSSPMEAKIAQGSSAAIQRGIASTNAAYRARDAQLEAAELGIEDPNALDFLGEAAGAGLNFAAMDYLSDKTAAANAITPPTPGESSVLPEPVLPRNTVGRFHYFNEDTFFSKPMRARSVYARTRR